MNRHPASNRAPDHRLFAIEYHCASCRPTRRGRFFEKPDVLDPARLERAGALWNRERPLFVPDDPIPPGDETARLHRWGYRFYRELFTVRQLLALELAARFISRVPDFAVRSALATNFSDFLRYRNMLCRYDTTSLKSLDVFSVHGFPVGLVQCESNFLGVVDPASGSPVGSGGWANVVAKYVKAKSYCHQPFEVRFADGKKEVVPVPGEWIGDRHPWEAGRGGRRVELVCGDAATAALSPGSVDAVLTDPPYLGNVQYAELMDFCYVWLRRLVGSDFPDVFSAPSTRHSAELTANAHMGRDVRVFAEGLSAIFGRMVEALKPGGPFVFTYHHNDPEAYYPVVVALLDAGLACTAVYACPAEMEASIHIRGTVSGTVDSVFVCRHRRHVHHGGASDWLSRLPAAVQRGLTLLRRAGHRPTAGDVRSIVYGHFVREAVLALQESWSKEKTIVERLARVEAWAGGPRSLSGIATRIVENVL